MQMIVPLFDMFTAAMFIFFVCGKFLDVRMPRTTTYPLWRPGPPGLTFYGSGLACLPSWVGMVNAGWLCSMRSEIFLKMKVIIFWGCPTELPFYLGSLLHKSASYSPTLDHEITLNIFKFVLNSIEKVKPGFSFSYLMCMFPESSGKKS